MSERIIEVKHLSKQFGRFTAVEDVSFDVYRGDVFGFLGPNGAGKSTTIRAMLSLITPTSGEINLFGKSLQANRSHILAKIGCIVEKPDFYKYLSAEKNLEIFARISGSAVSKSKIHEMIEFVGLKGREKDKVGHFSHGMKQRLGIAQTILHDPDLIILDEPNTGLDPQGSIDIRNLILKLKNEQNKTILLSSHILSEIEIIANRMVIIAKGNSIVQGNVAELLNSQDLIVYFEVDQPEKASHIISEDLSADIIGDIEKNIIQLHIAHQDIPRINSLLTENGLNVYGIESKRKLEDYFLKLVGKDVLEKHV
ncbi:MAG: ABC transporter ATP-binding protein [Prolixibacteraceae bacterium]|nr:ABC transporter ATP-binding protein [Prolixibacteraceae bacterium]